MLQARCLDENTLDALGRGALPPAAREAAVIHVDACSACRTLLAALGEAKSGATRRADLLSPEETLPSTERTEDPAPAPGSRLGRYTLLHPVGAGGMGVVWAAYDAQLDRRVALKLLRRERWTEGELGMAAARLLREAKSLARLSHPNVVSVFDAGAEGGQAFVAMEFIEGETLGRWCKAAPRTTEARIDAFVRAGRGLSAAHAAGLVHRDFKPENVLVSRDGRVCVTDFGLVRRIASEAEKETSEEGDEPAAPSSIEHLTRTGALLGTPAYMAPEQWRGGPVDARSDQFAFCVALHEVLSGERPYPSDAFADGRGAPPPPRPLRGRAPERVKRALARGLSPAPEDRYPGMDALLIAIVGRTSRRWSLGAAVGAALLVAGALALAARGRPGPSCTDADAYLAGTWDDARRARVREAFAATGVAYARVAGPAVEASLDRYARSVADMHTEACEATHVRAEQSGELLDLRMACLGRRRVALRAIVDVLASADARVVESAEDTVGGLRSLDECASTEALTAPTPLPPDAAARGRVDAARARLAEADALHAAGRYAPSRALAARSLDEARALGFRPLEAEALMATALADESSGAAKEAEQELEQALWAAQSGRHEVISAGAAIALIRVSGEHFRHYAVGRQWAGFAEAAIQRLGSPPMLAAARLDALGSMEGDAGHADEAAALLGQAITLREGALGREDPEVATALRGLAHSLVSLERYADAITTSERALGIQERALGVDHPEVANTLYTLAFALAKSGKPSEALPVIERAVAIKERAFGPDHPTLVKTLIGLADVETILDKNQEALAACQRALAIQERSTGPDDMEIANILLTLSTLHDHLGDLSKSLSCAQRALTVEEKILDPSNPELVTALYSVGLAHVKLKQPAEARVLLERALTLAELRPLTDSLAAGRYARTRILVFLAEALWATSGDRPRARALVQRAIDLSRDGNDEMKGEVKELERWLGEHPLARLHSPSEARASAR